MDQKSLAVPIKQKQNDTNKKKNKQTSSRSSFPSWRWCFLHFSLLLYSIALAQNIMAARRAWWEQMPAGRLTDERPLTQLLIFMKIVSKFRLIFIIEKKRWSFGMYFDNPRKVVWFSEVIFSHIGHFFHNGTRPNSTCIELWILFCLFIFFSLSEISADLWV